MKPLIGLTPSPETMEQDHGTFRLHTLNENYSRSVIAVGGIPVMLPTNHQDIDQLLDRLDGVILTGGGDVDPQFFGEAPHAATEKPDAERDAFEFALARAVIERDMPLLGICRGLQVLNVVLGGTLHQDIDALVDGSSEHRQQKQKIHHEQTFQSAQLEDGDHPLRQMAGADHIEINTFHHQAINKLADSLRVVARTEDGIVEAVYNPTMTFGLAVQWHPEMLQHAHAEHAAIFQALIEAASAYRSRASNREVPELV